LCFPHPCRLLVGLLAPYKGPLKAAGQSDTRHVEKHAIRCALSRQLDVLFGLKSEQFLDRDCISRGP
jgi:hypothetical protein